MRGTQIAAAVRSALLTAAKTMPIVVAIDATGCSVHGPQQEAVCAGNLVVWCPACWPNVQDGGHDAAPAGAVKAHDAGKDGR